MNVELKITLNETGQIAITGPVDNEMACYYLLEKARQAVADHHRKAAERLVQPGSMSMVPPLGGRRD